jgi:multidrug efflux pump
MNLSAPFIRRPIATSLLAAALLLAGAAAFTQLPVAPLPRVDFPTISVNASLPGASPITMATAVAMPLERRFGRIAGVTEITSSSSLGQTLVTVQFDLDRSVDSCARDVQAAINAAGGDLPPNLPSIPRWQKVNPADAPILIIALRSKSVPLPQVFEAANTVLAQKIMQVPGVGQVGVGGGVQPAVRIQVDPGKLAGLGLGFEDVRAALSAATANQPTGGVGDARWQAIGVDDQLLDAKHWENVVVHWAQPGEVVNPAVSPNTTIVANAGAPAAATAPGTGSTSAGLAAPTLSAATSGSASATTAASTNGAFAQAPGAVRLGDIAKVTDDVENARVAGWFDGDRTVMLIIRRQPGANILEVIDRVEKLLPQLVQSIRPGIDVVVALDRARTIRASVHDVEYSLVISILLVIAVVFVFLRSGRATAIPSVVVPLSLVATFGAMYVLRYSLDNLSLMALTIATGFVVDDAIVVTENITRHIELGTPPMQAALAGAKQIGFTIVSITASLLAVFIPILFMSGPYGRLFHEFAVTLALAISISAVLSLTLTPMMCSRLLRSAQHRPGYIGRALDRGLQHVIDAYGRALRFVLRHRIAVGLVFVATAATTVYLYHAMPQGLFPEQDTGMLQGGTQAPQDISFPAMRAIQEQINQIVKDDPDVAHVISNVGGFNASTLNTSTMFVALKDKPERTATAQEVIARLRPKLAAVGGGIFARVAAVQDVRVGGRLSQAQYQYTLEDAEIHELEEWAPKVTAALRKLPEIKDVLSDQQTGGLELDVDVDRETAARFGITEAQVDNTLYDAFGQRQIAVMYTQINQYRVVLEADPRIGTDPNALDRVYVTSATGAQVPLSAFVHVRRANVALSIGHQGQFPATTISFNTAPGVALGQAVAAIDRATAAIGMPTTITGSFTGNAQAFQDSTRTTPILLLLAVVVVYLVLGVLYESYVHPLTILSTLPSAGLGALLALMWWGSDLNLIAMVGLILLIGIVKKNAILMIDFAIEQEREGKPAEQAIYQAALLRFRPIIMTTLAALLGALPLALGSGIGSELRRPLGISIVGGLVVSQLLTLFTTPVVYLWLHRFTRRRREPL